MINLKHLKESYRELFTPDIIYFSTNTTQIIRRMCKDYNKVNRYDNIEGDIMGIGVKYKGYRPLTDEGINNPSEDQQH